MNRIVLLLSSVLFASQMLAQNPSMELQIEEIPVLEPAFTTISNELGAAPRTYRVFAAFPDNYQLLTLYGVTGEAWTLESDEPLYQDPNGGPTTLSINPFQVATFPELTYDSWFTIGDTDSLENEIVIVTLDDSFENWDNGGELNINDLFGSSIFAPAAGDTEQNSPDPNGRVLIGQFTSSGNITGCFNLQIRRLNEDGTIFDPEGPANFEDATFNLCFDTSNAGTCSADFDVNGVVDINDLLSLLAEYGCLENCVTDLDGDDVVGASDLLVFLVAFGVICAE